MAASAVELKSPSTGSRIRQNGLGGRALPASGMVHHQRLQPVCRCAHAPGRQRVWLARARGTGPQVGRMATDTREPAPIRRIRLFGRATRSHAVGQEPASEWYRAAAGWAADRAIHGHGTLRRREAATSAGLLEEVE